MQIKSKIQHLSHGFTSLWFYLLVGLVWLYLDMKKENMQSEKFANILTWLQSYLEEPIGMIPLEDVLSISIHIKWTNQRVKGAYEKLMHSSFDTFHNTTKCNCGEEVIVSYILQAFILPLQCDDERSPLSVHRPRLCDDSLASGNKRVPKLKSSMFCRC